MSVQDLKNALSGITGQAQEYVGQIAAFQQKNQEAISQTKTVFEGTGSGADAQVAAALGAADASLNGAKSAMGGVMSTISAYQGRI